MQATKTTVHLKLPDPRKLWYLPVPATCAIVVFCLIAIAALVGQIRSTPEKAPAVVATQAPIIVIQREIRSARAAPAPTPQVVYVYIDRPAPVVEQPVVVEPVAAPVVNQPVQEAPEQPAAVEQPYQVTNSEPPPQQQPAQQAPAAAVAAPAQQQPIYPTVGPMQETDTMMEWARQQWQAEHCSGSGEQKRCIP